MFYILLIFLIFPLFGNLSSGDSGNLVWRQISAKSGNRPSGIFDALTWADDRYQLWLFSGKKVVRKNESEVKKDVYELWKFNQESYKWIKVVHKNSSGYPKLSNGLSCFCHGRAFVFGQQVHNNESELWAYNISSNAWNLIQTVNHFGDMNGCFALWCDKSSDSLSLICHSNMDAIKLWVFKLKTMNWEPINITERIHVDEGISKLDQFSLWNDEHDGLVFMYVWSSQNMSKDSVLLSISHDNVAISKVNITKPEYWSSRNGFVRWVDDNSNLHLLGIASTGSVNTSVHWMLKSSNLTWIQSRSRYPDPSPRFGANVWQVDGNVWLFGGYRKDKEGHVVVLDDLWIGISITDSKPVIPQPTHVNHDLPGDTLGLSLTNKLIISMVTLCIVLAVSIRLCYKRELNKLMSGLKKNRVLYHQLSQEGDKSTRL
ncbi:uncharacterized protein LOC114522170 [Dendronephthya gigantea]|uniref:uncharacterized protein LOC114522170 n=1 Tax=Dendronephthya gigantea TaxID=151771 RepID=UPI00106A95C0|nr:uncharacterized protein LOC114522170 [Dendronephthya gigantea]